MKKLALLAVAAFISLTAFADAGYKVGDNATDFSLKNINGKMVSLADYKDAKGFIVIFTCNHCPFSVKYQERIVELAKWSAKKGYPVVAINPNDTVAYPDDSYANMQKRAKEQKFNFPYLVDGTQQIAKTYGATKTPHVYVLQKGAAANLVVSYIGAIDDNADDAKAVKVKYVEQAVNELLSGKPVSVNTTKAVGCGIKWKK